MGKANGRHPVVPGSGTGQHEHTSKRITKTHGKDTSSRKESKPEACGSPKKYNQYKWIKPTQGSSSTTSSTYTKESAISSENIKDEAVQFLKEKLSKKKVHINKHHASFRNKSFNGANFVAADGKAEEPKEGKNERRKEAAVNFLKQCGLTGNKVHAEHPADLKGNRF